MRSDDEAELRHDHFMAKVPKLLGEAAPKFSGTAFYVNDISGKVERAIYTFPKRESCLMALIYSYNLQAGIRTHDGAGAGRGAGIAISFASCDNSAS